MDADGLDVAEPKSLKYFLRNEELSHFEGVNI